MQSAPQAPSSRPGSYLESIPLTTSEESTTKSELNPFSATGKKLRVEVDKPATSVQSSESHLSGSSMVLIGESEAGKVSEPGASPEEAKGGLSLEPSEPLFSPAKAPRSEAPSKHDLPRKDGLKHEEESQDWSILGFLGVLGVVLLGGLLLAKRASR